MNRRLTFPILSALAGIAAGWLAGKGVPVRDAAPAKPESPMAASRSAERQRSTSTKESSMPLNFASYVKRVAKPAEKAEAEEAAARMSNGELREMLLKLPEISWEKGQISKRDFVLYQAGDALGAELFRREGIPALDWVASTGKKEAFAALLKALCAADPAASKKYTITYHTAFPGGTGWEYAAAGVHAAALRGPAELLEVQKLWDGTGFDNIPDFAPDFDFAAFLAKAEPGRIPAGPLVAWVGRDPEAAGAAIARGLKDGAEWDNVLGKALESRALLAGEEEAARWIAPLIAGSSGYNREMAVSNLAQDISAARAAALVPALPEDRDRIQLALAAMRNDYNGKRNSLQILQALPSEELRVQALTEALAKKDPRMRMSSRESRVAYLEKIAPKLGLSEAARQRVQAAIPAE